MPSSPADTFAVIVALTDKLVADQPRNLDLARLRFLLNVLKAEQPRKRDWTPPARPPPSAGCYSGARIGEGHTMRPASAGIVMALRRSRAAPPVCG